jgi:hypothetical protein
MKDKIQKCRKQRKSQKGFDVGKYFNSLPQNQRTDEPLLNDSPIVREYREDRDRHLRSVIERSEATELAYWNKHIDPIIKKHNLKTDEGEYIQYKYFERSINEINVYVMLRKTVLECRKIYFERKGVLRGEPYDPLEPLEDRLSEDLFKVVVIPLRDAQPGNSQVDYLREVFRSFLFELYENETLPEFLELLRRKDPAAKFGSGLGSTESEVLQVACQNPSKAGESDRFLKDGLPLSSCVEKTIDRRILEYGTAAEHLYNCMVVGLKHIGKNLARSTDDERRTAAVNKFDANPKAFFPLRRADIEGGRPYPPCEKDKRQMIGMIIQHALATFRDAKSNSQSLYARFLELKKSLR